jgi:hypothetical protein
MSVAALSAAPTTVARGCELEFGRCELGGKFGATLVLH